MDLDTPSFVDPDEATAQEDAVPPPERLLLMLVGRESRLPDGCRRLCDLLGYEVIAVSDADDLITALKFRRPAAVLCEEELAGITSWFLLARLAHAGCNPDVVVEARADDPDLRAAFAACQDLLGLTHVRTVAHRLRPDDVGELLGRATLRAHGGAAATRH
ncbi:hypothetical protein [Acidisphaera rubrifaciens]|uniref:Response regulatory domain-containing protein n=1 Tax=Acidisphaera rubrifaciens HS-AP3 TaxID=1231350 RepID=A0A0D6P6U7_9PROT|nr:hypothetical protein [Acidisphaera rubrifaciens]GAN76923.1 hypothetical protein Asru_0192_02 [Acidisphaera rubrifaciens HS-AP3]